MERVSRSGPPQRSGASTSEPQHEPPSPAADQADELMDPDLPLLKKNIPLMLKKMNQNMTGGNLGIGVNLGIGAGMTGTLRGDEMMQAALTDDDDAFEDVLDWADLEVDDQEILPAEVLGWLLLRRAGLPASSRLSVQASVGNSLKFSDLERALRD